MKMLRHCYLLVLFLFGAGLGPARAQHFAWAKIARGAIDTTFTAPQANATDAAGNTYVAVSYKDSLRFGSILLTGPPNSAQAVVKYDATGAVVWAQALNYIRVAALAADNSAGGVFVVATSAGAATWGGTAVPVGPSATFYAKCSATGALQWSNALPTPYNVFSYPPRVVADNTGSAYIAGTASVAGSVGTTPISSADSYVFKANGAGSVQWVRTLHTSSPSPPALVLGPKPGGGCLLGGTIANSALYLGAGTATPLLPGRALTDGFLTSFDGAGTHQWSQVIGIASATVQGYVTPYALAADASGNCYVSGTTFGTVALGGATLVNGFLLAKYNAAGAVQWARDAQVPSGSAGYQLAVGSSGPTLVVYAFLSNAPVLNVGTLALRSFFNVVHYNDQGVVQWAVADTWLSRNLPYFFPTGLGIDGQDNLYPVGRPSDPFNNFSVIQLGAQTTVGKGAIVARLNAYANTLRGQVYFDLNGNGQQDATEGLFPRQLTGVLTQGGATTYSAVGNTGELQAYAGTGAYSLTVAQLPARYTLTQPSGGAYAGTFSGSSQLVSGQNFGLAPISNLTDVRVTLTPYSVARPGFTTRYRLTLSNEGTTTASGTATVGLDSRLAYISSTPSASRTGQTLTWTYTNLAPMAQLDYDILFSLPTNAVLGTVLTSTAAAPLSADVEPADNAATLAQTVVGAYDPNSIEVNYERITPAQVTAQQWLEYTIHFQNLGTAAAVNVILSDTLDYQKLNPASLQWITQSHNCSWSLTSIGPNSGLLTVRFLGINLPERNVDVIRSMGFVRFRVRPRPTLAVGEIIPNHAGIVFDYNSAVLTNTATTTVFLATAALARSEAAAWDAYPNPATDALTLSADLATAGPVRVELLDALGRPVRQQTLQAPAGPLRQTVDLRGLAAGLYVLRLTPPTGAPTSRQVVHR